MMENDVVTGLHTKWWLLIVLNDNMILKMTYILYLSVPQTKIVMYDNS